jgi:uncharacterized RDD family membrane protein YckC
MSNVEDVWRRRSDEQLTEAASLLHEYTSDGQQAIRAELQRRGLPEPPLQQSALGHDAPALPEYPLASRLRRFTAVVIDTALIAPGFAALERNVYVAPVAAYMLCVAAIEVALLVTRGTTIGKKLLGLRIVDAISGDHPGIARILIMRSVLPNLAYGIPLLGPLLLVADAMFIFTKQRQTLHDQMARTLVVNTRAMS